MKIFVAASYSSQVNYEAGEVFPEYKAELEKTLSIIETAGHETFCALRADKYKINDADPAEAFKLDIQRIKKADVLLALLTEKVSAGVQTEIGVAITSGKLVILAHEPRVTLQWFNQAIIKAGAAKEVTLPLTKQKLEII